jgi:hypothetical protein
MCLKDKFIFIETQLNENVKKTGKEFIKSYNVITRQQAAKGMLCSGNTFVMIGNAAVSSYKKSSEESKNLILEIFNGKDNKIYTCLGTNRLKKIFKNYKITLQEHLETELNKTLHSPALGGNTLPEAKRQVQEEMKPKFRGSKLKSILFFLNKHILIVVYLVIRNVRFILIGINWKALFYEVLANRLLSITNE